MQEVNAQYIRSTEFIARQSPLPIASSVRMSDLNDEEHTVPEDLGKPLEDSLTHLVDHSTEHDHNDELARELPVLESPETHVSSTRATSTID